MANEIDYGEVVRRLREIAMTPAPHRDISIDQYFPEYRPPPDTRGFGQRAYDTAARTVDVLGKLYNPENRYAYGRAARNAPEVVGGLLAGGLGAQGVIEAARSAETGGTYDAKEPMLAVMTPVGMGPSGAAVLGSAGGGRRLRGPRGPSQGRPPGPSLHDFDYTVPKPMFNMSPDEAAAARSLRDVGISRVPELPDVSTPLKAGEIPNIRNMPTADAIAIARGEPHAKLTGPKGNIAGAPDWVKTPADLQKLRDDVDKLMLGGATDPTKANITGWDWYKRSRSASEALSGGVMPSVFTARLGGEMSPNASPESEIGYSLRERNAALVNPPEIKLDKDGNPVPWKTSTGKVTDEPTLEGGVKAGRPQQHQNFLRALMMQDPLEMARGQKTSEYATKQGPEGIEAADIATGVNDYRMQQVFGYKGPTGLPVKSSEASARSPAVHRFMDFETALAVMRANEMKLGGKSDWTGEELQAMLWTRNKAQDLQRRSKGRKGDKPGITYDEALEIAANNPFDYQGKHTAYATHEQIPGAPREFTQALINAPKSVQDEFSRAASWRDPVTGRDRLYGGLRVGDTPMGMLVAPTVPMQGAWRQPAASGVGPPHQQLNLGEVAQPQVGLLPREGKIDPASRSILEMGELTRAYVDAQQAGAAHVLFPKVKAGKMGSIEIPMTRPMTRAEADELLQRVNKHGFADISDRGNGVTITTFGADPNGAKVGRMLKKGQGPGTLIGDIKSVLPNAEPRRVGVDSVYESFTPWEEGAVSRWAKEGSGEATRHLLDQLDKNPVLRDAYDRNIGIVQKAAENLMRNDQFAKSLGVSAPRDIQNALRVISEGGRRGWIGRLRAALARGEVLPAVVGPLLAAVLASPSEDGSSSQ